MKIVVLDRKTLGDDLDLSPLQAIGEVIAYDSTVPEQVKDRIADCDVVVINKVRLNRENLSEAKNLKLICLAATGYDNVNCPDCRALGIAVCNVVGYSTQSVAQLTVTMALHLISHLPAYGRFVQHGEYTESGVANRLIPVYHEICGLTWGVIGYGNIGAQVGKVASALGCRVLAYSRSQKEGVENVDLDTLCRESDILSIHLPLSDQTRGLISKEKIALMKPTALVINVARGAVWDESAIVQAIRSRRLGGIGCDVYSTEPFPKNHPFTQILGRDNVCLTPHMAWGAYEARVRCLDEICQNITAFFSGEKRNRVE